MSSMIQYLIGRARIKYSVLDTLFHSVYIQQDRIVMYVDASSILYRLYRNKDIDMIDSVSHDVAVKDMVISFLNTLAHYRRYFITRLNKTNDIIVFYNRKQPIYQSMIFDGYRKNWYDMMKKNHQDYSELNMIIDDAFKFIQGLVPYFEGIYLVDNKEIDDYTAIAHYIHSKEYSNSYHLIFSRNMLPTQLVSNNCSVLYNKRDDSVLLTNSTVFKNGVLKGRKTAAVDTMSPKMLPFIWTLGGCSDIELKKSKYANGVADAVKMLNPLVDSNKISANMSIQSFLKELSKHMDDCSMELKSLPEGLINRYRILNLSLAESALNNAQKITLWKDHIDLYDQTGLEEINDKLSQIDENEELLEITNLNMSTAYQDNGMFAHRSYGGSGGFGDFFNFSI